MPYVGKEKNIFGPGVKLSLYTYMPYLFLKIIEVELLCYCVVLCQFLLFSNMNRLLLFSCSVPSYLWTHGLQYTRPPCPSPSPGARSNSCLSSQWCHPTIPSSVVPFSSCLWSFPASGFFPSESVLCIRWPKCWSFSFSISPSNEYSGLVSFRIDWLQSKRLSRGFSNTTVQKHQFYCTQLSL